MLADFAMLDQNSSAYHPMLMINIFWFLFRLCSAEVTRVCIYLLPMKVYKCELVIKILNPLSSYE